MKLIDPIARLSIGQQILLAALLPLLLLTMALSIYMITSQLDDARQRLTDEGATLASYLSRASERSLFTESSEALEQIAREPLKRSEVTDILFYNVNLKRLYSGDNSRIDLDRIISASSLKSGRQRIDLPGLEGGKAIIEPVISDVDDIDQSLSSDRHLGWVVVLLNEQQLSERRQQILLRGLMISVAALLLALALVHRVSRNISKPIIELSENLQRYHRGEFSPANVANPEHEIGALQRGINDLVNQVQQQQLQLQSEVKRTTRNLQGALKELELNNCKLQKSKDEIELTGAAKDQFMARMGHELRTPISSVLGFVQLLEKSSLDDSQQEYCRIIQNASVLLLRLIDDVLDFSKFETDNLELEQIAFNPEQCIDDVIEMHAPAAAEKGLQLEFNCNAQWSLNLSGDPTRFSQVLTNLIGNAIKFTESGSVKVQMSSKKLENRTLLLIAVEDTGIGIPAEQLAGLFQPFSQADTSINRRFGGSGLGLALSKRLIKLMHGDLQLTSIAGEGSCFRISLWMDNAPEVAPLLLPALNVLLCCTDEPQRQRYHQQLQQWGCQVDCLSDRLQLVGQMLERKPQYDRVIVCLALEELKVLSWNQFLNPVRKCFSGELILVTEHNPVALELDTERLMRQLMPARMLLRPVARRQLFHALQGSVKKVPKALDQPLMLEGLSILLAEDNRFNRLLFSRMLQVQGAQVVVVDNGHDGWVMAAEQSFDLILMDLHMPVHNGLDACRNIRQLPGAAGKTPIMVLTADVVTQKRELLEPLDLQGILYKPIDELLLVRQILQVLKPDLLAGRESDMKARFDRFGISTSEVRQALEEQFDELQQALLQGNRQLLRDNVHQLAGVAEMAGLERLDGQLDRFRQAVRNKEMSVLWQLFWQMKENFDLSKIKID